MCKPLVTASLFQQQRKPQGHECILKLEWVASFPFICCSNDISDNSKSGILTWIPNTWKHRKPSTKFQERWWKIKPLHNQSMNLANTNYFFFIQKRQSCHCTWLSWPTCEALHTKQECTILDCWRMRACPRSWVHGIHPVAPSAGPLFWGYTVPVTVGSVCHVFFKKSSVSLLSKSYPSCVHKW